ncbi:hypothetical protein KCU85_g206, partial [Aureobasidium melanogenum]
LSYKFLLQSLSRRFDCHWHSTESLSETLVQLVELAIPSSHHPHCSRHLIACLTSDFDNVLIPSAVFPEECAIQLRYWSTQPSSFRESKIARRSFVNIVLDRLFTQV